MANLDKPVVTGFNNRGTPDHPFGFIEFNDGMRIGYSPGARGTNPDGLFDPEQSYNLRDLDLRAAHWTAATRWVRGNLSQYATAPADAEA
jgi:hypothetical protein